MFVNAISSVGNVNFKGDVAMPLKKTEENENLKSAGLSPDASNALKAQILYRRPKNETQYLDGSLDKKGIIKALKNKEKMGRSFFCCKRRVANIITKADDKNLAVDNFNVLMNAQYKNGKMLNAADITDILLVATSINNKKVSEKLKKEYGFNGGLLDDKSVDSILDKIVEQRQQQQFAMIQQQMTHQRMMNEQFMQQMALNQQMRMQQQMMHQHMMMTTPGMGYC